MKAVRRVCNHCMNTVIILAFEPIEAICMKQSSFANSERLFLFSCLAELTLCPCFRIKGM